MKTIISLILASTLLSISSQGAQVNLIASWDFDRSPGTDLRPFQSDQGNMPKVFKANSGSGTLFADGTHGSSEWLRQGELLLGDPESRELSVMAGSSGRGLAFRQTANAVNLGNDARGKSIVFAISMENYSNLDITYEYRRSSADTFSELMWEYSVDGVNWSVSQNISYIGQQQNWTSEDRLKTITGLSNAETAFIRVTFFGASQSPSGDRGFIFDNIHFKASRIP